MTTTAAEARTVVISNQTLFVVALIACVSTGPLAMQLFFPAVPFITREFASHPAVSQLAISLSMAAMAFATVAYGPLSDRYGRRPLMMGGLLIFLAGTVVCAVAPDIETLIAGRIIQAAGGAAGSVMTRAVVRDVYGPDRSASLMAYMMVAMVVAPLIALNIGGLLTDAVGWRAGFWFAFAFGVVVFLLLRRGVPESHLGERIATRPAVIMRAYLVLLRSPDFNGYAGHAAFAVSTFFAFMAAAPAIMVETLNSTAFEFSLNFIVLTVTFMAANALAGRISTRLGIDRMVWLGGGVSLISAAALFASLWWWGLNTWSLFLPVAFVGVGNGLSIPNASAGAINTDARLIGTASGLSAFLMLAVSAAVTQLVGEFADGSAWPLAWFIFGATVASIGLGAIPRWRKRRRSLP